MKNKLLQTLKWLLRADDISDTFIFRGYLKIRSRERYEANSRALVLRRAIRHERDFFRNLLQAIDAKIVFDIGAHLGNKTFAFSKVVDTGISLEPSPVTSAKLQQRFAAVPGVSVVAEGVGAQTGSLPFHVFADCDFLNTFSKKWAEFVEGGERFTDRKRLKATSTVSVPVTTLDHLIDRFGLPDFLKIDVEGYESEVLKGLSQPVKLLSIECNLPELETETLACLSRIAELYSVPEFNFCITEPQSKFYWSHWRSQAEITAAIESNDHSFMEIYARNRQNA
jgi:FkbM family methyltransferase